MFVFQLTSYGVALHFRTGALHQVENKNISDRLNKRATKLYYRLTMILQNIPSQPTEEFLTSIEKISDEIESLVARSTDE